MFIGLGLGLNNQRPASGAFSPSTIWTANANFSVTGGLTATRSAGAGDQNVRANVTRTSGYFEVTPTFASGGITIGLCEASFAANVSPGQDTHSIGWDGAGGIYMDGAFTGITYAALATATTVGVAPKAGKLHLGVWNGSSMTWQGGSDPSAGTGGIVLSANCVNLIPVVACNTNASQAFAAKFETGFLGAIPTGLTAWV